MAVIVKHTCLCGKGLKYTTKHGYVHVDNSEAKHRIQVVVSREHV